MAVFTVGYLIAVLLDASPWLRGTDEWHWWAADRPLSWRVLPLLLLLVGIAALAFWLERRRPTFHSRWLRGGFLTLLVVLSLGEQVAVLTLEPDGPLAQVLQRTVSPMSNGYYTAALDVGPDVADLAAFLRDYPAQMSQFVAEHPRTHPPGLLIGHWLVIQGVRGVPALADPLETWARRYQCPVMVGEGRSAADLSGALVAGGLLMLVGALTVVPLYHLGRRLGGNAGGWRAAILYLLLPAAALFVPETDHLYPLLTATSLLALVVGLEARQPVPIFISGLLVSLGSFLSLGCGALALFLALCVLFWPGRPSLRAFREWLSLAVSFAVGLATVWLIYWLLCGVNPWQIAAVARSQHYALTVSHRSYLTWLGFNLYDFLAFLGWPVTFLWLRLALTRRGGAVRAVAWALWLTLLLLDLSGTTRGEVARLWLFLMPPAIVAAAVTAGRDLGGRSWQAVVGLQAVLVFVLAFSWQVIAFATHPVAAVSRRFESPPPAHQQLAVFGDQIELLGYDLSPDPVRPGETLSLTLHWRALSEPPHSYKVFVHLLGPDGEIRAQADGVPVDWALPTICWLRGEVVADPYALTLPADAPAGDYTLAVGFYLESTGGRLAVGESDHVSLGPVRVE